MISHLAKLSLNPLTHCVFISKTFFDSLCVTNASASFALYLARQPRVFKFQKILSRSLREAIDSYHQDSCKKGYGAEYDRKTSYMSITAGGLPHECKKIIDHRSHNLIVFLNLNTTHHVEIKGYIGGITTACPLSGSKLLICVGSYLPTLNHKIIIPIFQPDLTLFLVLLQYAI